MWSRRAPPTIQGVSIIGAARVVTSVILAWRLLRAIKKEGGLQR